MQAAAPSVPPRSVTPMKTFRALEERQLYAGNAASLESGMYQEGARAAKKAMLLSIVPGLGQLYNGESGKGYTFLVVAVLSYAFCISLIFSTNALQALQFIAQLIGLQVDWTTAQRLSVSPSVIVISYALLFSFIVFAAREAADHALRLRQGASYPKYKLGIAEATSGSYLAHYTVLMLCAVMALLWAVPQVPVTTVTEIEFVAPPKPSPPPAPKREHKRHVDSPKPVPVVVEKPVEVKPVVQPTPKPIVVQPVEPVAIATTAPSTTGDVVNQANPAGDSGAPVTGTGSSSGNSDAGSGAGGQSQEVDTGPWMNEVQKRIKKAWFPPKGNESKKIILRFKVQPDGTVVVSSIRLKESSGVSIADAAAQSAVEHASLPPLPAGINQAITINFTFDYNVFSGG
jgi:TonB family protein